MCALKSELAAKEGIHEAGVEKAAGWPENVGFMTVWYNKTMVKRIERDIKENGAVSLFTRLCPATSNCDLQSARHDAGWYKGDKLTGAYQVDKDFKFGTDPTINDGTKSSLLAVTHCFVATAQHDHDKPPHFTTSV